MIKEINGYVISIDGIDGLAHQFCSVYRKEDEKIDDRGIWYGFNKLVFYNDWKKQTCEIYIDKQLDANADWYVPLETLKGEVIESEAEILRYAEKYLKNKEF